MVRRFNISTMGQDRETYTVDDDGLDSQNSLYCGDAANLESSDDSEQESFETGVESMMTRMVSAVAVCQVQFVNKSIRF